MSGGAGAVGNAAIQLARWSDATIITTVSSPQKAQLAAAAGADHVIDYRQQDVLTEVRKIVPGGVDVVVEVNPQANAEQYVAGGGGDALACGLTSTTTSTPPGTILRTSVEHVLLAVVDDVVRARGGASWRLLRAADRGDDRGVGPAGELDGGVADRAGTAPSTRTVRPCSVPGPSRSGPSSLRVQAALSGEERDAERRTQVVRALDRQRSPGAWADERCARWTCPTAA